MVIDFEQALLGAVLEGYRDIPGLTRTITPQDFYQPAHEQIWNSILAIHSAGHTPNPILVKSELGNKANNLPGGALYLVELKSDHPIQAPLYAAKVREQSIRRQIASIGARFQQLTNDADTDPDQMLEQARSWIDELGHRGDPDLIDIHTAFEQVIDVTENGEPDAIPSPWSQLNELIHGWYPGQLITIGARPGVGKSIFVENAGTHVARVFGKHVLFVSLEMSAKEITQRTTAHAARVPLSKVRGRIEPSDPDMLRIANVTAEITKAPIKFACNGRQTIATIRATAWEQKQAARRAGSDLGLIVIDYMQLITARDRKLNRQQQVGEISRGLKQLAKELDVPVLAAAQLNRANQGRRDDTPMLSDLREAGDIEQDSDVVIFLHEDFVQDGDRKLATGDVSMIVAKNRHGSPGTRTAQKHGHYGKLT